MICLAPSCMLGNESRYLQQCVDTNMVSSNGAFVTMFEEAVATACGASYCVAVNSGTSALHIALILSGIGKGDKVILPDVTFIAPANAVRYVGAVPVFVDVEPEYWQMDMEKVAERLTYDGSGIRGIIPVHLHGHPVDLAALSDICSVNDVVIIEDAAEALGARYDREGYLGRPFFGLSCLSFNGNKIVTCGGGGAILTNDEGLAREARHLTTQAKSDPLEYVHDEIGYNYRMTNIQAALGLAQIETLPERVKRKRAIAERYRRWLADVPGLTHPKEAPWAFSTYWMYSVLVDPVQFGMTARKLRDELKGRDIETRTLWRPLSMQPPYGNCEAFECMVSHRLYEQSLSLPIGCGLTEAEQAQVCEAIRDASKGMKAKGWYGAI